MQGVRRFGTQGKTIEGSSLIHFICTLEPRWIVDQEIKRRLDEYEANEREMQERLDVVRKAKQKKMDEMKHRANFARKRQVSCKGKHALRHGMIDSRLRK